MNFKTKFRRVCPITSLTTLGSRVRGLLGALRCLREHDYGLLVAASGQLKAVSLPADGDSTRASGFKLTEGRIRWDIGKKIFPARVQRRCGCPVP